MRGTIHKPGATTEWLEFVDPEDPEMLFRVNVSFLTSGYNCIFGRGCPGLLNRGVDYTRGCCERGVTFVNDEDYENIQKSVDMLTEEDCDNLEHVQEKGWAMKSPKGKPYKTKKVNGACIFRNTTPGREGCAFHVLGMRVGVNPAELKPNICWTVPIRSEVDWDDRHDVFVHTISAWDADDWGGTDDDEEESGRGHMGYWCIDTPDAYNGLQPMYQSHAYELTKLMGESGYNELCRLFKERGYDSGQRPVGKMPGEVRNEGRPMLPLLIEKRS